MLNKRNDGAGVTGRRKGSKFYFINLWQKCVWIHWSFDSQCVFRRSLKAAVLRSATDSGLWKLDYVKRTEETVPASRGAQRTQPQQLRFPAGGRWRALRA